jgi:DnaK suppressor protein
MSRGDRLEQALTEATARIRDLEVQYDHLVESAVGSNSDDEHDPDGATLAYERQQLVALIEQSHVTRDDLIKAIAALEQGAYGICERCGGPIGEERLEARPNALTCISCAGKR